MAASTGLTAADVVELGQGEAVALAAGTAAARIRAAAAEAAVALLPQSSLSSHLRGSSLLSFFK